MTPLAPELYGPPEIPILNLSYDPLNQTSSDFLPLSPKQPSSTPDVSVNPNSLATIASTIASDPVTKTRTALFAALLAFGYDAGTDGSTADLKDNLNLNYTDAPLLGAPWNNQPR